VLLSSLQGAAITSIKIENVLHEFSSLAGVREDVTDIVLNVKQIALKMQGEGPKRLQLSATGPAESGRRHRRLGRHRGHEQGPRDLPPRRGRDAQHGADRRHRQGLRPAGRNRPADAPIGLIPVDSLYSPVRQVSYKVDNARIGQELDFDKLSLTIETDGTVTPEDAVGLRRAHPPGPARAVRPLRGACPPASTCR
jgi:DNA-directed RNA polymerase subunit alpha